ncbi:MAG: dihydroorotase [Verrucomicrobiae bacterium]|nr:dihydroorotase [Verrucomicrobiae bacterium]
MMPLTLELPRWFDLHTHFRQGPAMPAYVKAHLDMGCAGVLAMPNTRPPISRVTGAATEESWSIEHYRGLLNDAGAGAFEKVIIPLYLTRDTTAEMIAIGAGSGALEACKYYPPHGTTNSEHGVPMTEFIGGDVLRAMEEHRVVLCIHGEQHALPGDEYLSRKQSAESIFYRDALPRLRDAHPDLRIVCEHITTHEAVDFVQSADSQVAATVTPQHLLYTLGHLIQGLRYHLYCLPIVKFEDDRAALREAVSKPGQTKFFAGTDSAPHTTKATDCGCAAGCFTGGCAPQLYAMAFEAAGADLAAAQGADAFTAFLSNNGPKFYGFPVSDENFALIREASRTDTLETPEGKVTPLPLGMQTDLAWSIVR